MSQSICSLNVPKHTSFPFRHAQLHDDSQVAYATALFTQHGRTTRAFNFQCKKCSAHKLTACRHRTKRGIDYSLNVPTSAKCWIANASTASTDASPFTSAFRKPSMETALKSVYTARAIS